MEIIDPKTGKVIADADPIPDECFERAEKAIREFDQKAHQRKRYGLDKKEESDESRRE